MQHELLRSVEVAEILQINDATLIAWRAQRRGPRWITDDAGRIRYYRRDVELWLADHQRDERTRDAPCPRWRPKGRGGSKV